MPPRLGPSQWCPRTNPYTRGEQPVAAAAAVIAVLELIAGPATSGAALGL
jgi:hypothetical protein